MNDNDIQAVATTPKAAILAGDRGLQLNDLDSMWRFASAIVKSGLQPKGFTTTEAVLIALQMAAELGMPPLAGLQNIAVINGRPGVYGDAALACVRASGLLADYSETITGTGDERTCTVTSLRRGSRQPIVSTFSVRDAKQAKLWGKQGPWSEYPDRMLKFRARGFNLRDNFGDVLKGFRTVEEIRDIEAEVVSSAPVFTQRKSIASGPTDIAPSNPAPAAAPTKTELEDFIPAMEPTVKSPTDRLIALLNKEPDQIKEWEVLDILKRKNIADAESVVELDDNTTGDVLENWQSIAAQVRLYRKQPKGAK